MDKRTLRALLGSIDKWENIVAGLARNNGSEDCPLCGLFHRAGPTPCEGCPVAERTGLIFCEGSPYSPCLRAEDQFGRDSIEYMQAAMAELEFLKSLLPEPPSP